jgi:hypothetical protein
MAADPWDDRLRERLGDYAEEGLPSAWDDMARRLDQAAGPSDPADQPLREALADFRAEGPVTGWDRIATTLDQADHAWEETLRRKVASFEAPADPHGWSQFVGYWRDSRFVRTKLILLKGIEAMALLLIVLTFTRQGAFHIPSPTNLDAPAIAGIDDRKVSPPEIISQVETRPGDEADAASFRQASDRPQTLNSSPASSEPAGTPTAGQDDLSGHAGKETQTGPIAGSANAEEMVANSPVIGPVEDTHAEHRTGSAQIASILTEDSNAVVIPSSPSLREAYNEIAPVDPLDILLARDEPSIPLPEPSRKTGRSAAELSVFALADMSALRMSEERIYSLGQQVVFPEKRLYSQGFGGGITIATGHPRYALETGILYSSRTFSPGRMVTLGNALDNSTVDFQALRLQLVSVPLQGRIRLDRKGRIQTYAAGGMTFTVVAQSDLDVVSSYNFTSLAAGADPNSDPVIARTLRETRRISETLRDGAPFSSKNYVSLNGGLGVEYVIMHHKKLFLQAQAQYQIPNLEFSNHNGKDLRALVVQAGLRSSLGY